MLALPKEVQNVLVLPTVGNAKNYLVYIVGLHGDKGKAKTHLGQNIYSVWFCSKLSVVLFKWRSSSRRSIITLDSVDNQWPSNQ